MKFKPNDIIRVHPAHGLKLTPIRVVMAANDAYLLMTEGLTRNFSIQDIDRLCVIMIDPNIVLKEIL